MRGLLIKTNVETLMMSHIKTGGSLGLKAKS